MKVVVMRRLWCSVLVVLAGGVAWCRRRVSGGWQQGGSGGEVATVT
nr:hypothetical protein [Tanacetum cinerariifolium]